MPRPALAPRFPTKFGAPPLPLRARERSPLALRFPTKFEALWKPAVLFPLFGVLGFRFLGVPLLSASACCAVGWAL
eukprot:2444926-Pyramimonas_sp.AAC.1